MAGENTNLNIDEGKYQKALKAAEKMSKEVKNTVKGLEAQKAIIDGISSAIFNVSGSAWFKEVPKSMEDLAGDYEQIKKIDSALKSAGTELNNMFKNSKLSESAKTASASFRKAFKTQIDLVSVDLKESFNIDKEVGENEINFKSLVDGIKKAAKEGLDFKKTYDDLSVVFGDNEKLQKRMNKLYDEQKEYFDIGKKAIDDESGNLAFINDIEDDHLKMKILEGLADGDIVKAVKEQGTEVIQILATSGAINEEQAKMLQSYQQQVDAAKESKKELLSSTKTVFDLKGGFAAIGKNLLKEIVPKMMEFDNTIHDAQKTTGIMFTQNEAAMTGLITKTAQFGMNVKEASEFMGTMSEELRTTDFKVLAQATDDLKAVQLATGISAENLGTMAGEMMRNGASSKEVADSMAEANVTAKQFGVSSKKVLDGMSKNITKMRTMGFTGGVESLTKMVATAERLRMNVDEIFDVAKKARSIEGSMEMAAELQLAGGSFANINPMDLLSAARKGPAELQKILTSMGSDIGKFDEKTGKMEFDPVDVDRLQIVADATGQSLDSIEKGIEKTAQDNSKLKMFPDDMFSIEGLDPDAVKSQISDAIEIGKDGTLQVKEGNIFGAKSLDDLKNMTKADMQAKMKEVEKNAANLEEQAKQNQSLEKSFTAFKDTILNLMTIFQPILNGLTWVIQGITQVIQLISGTGIGKVVLTIAALTAAIFLFLPSLIGALGKAAISMNPKNWGAIFKGGGIKGLLGSSGKGGTEDITKTQEAGGKVEGAPKGEGGLKSLAEGLKAMGGEGVLKGIGNTLLAGPALLFMIPALPGLLILAVAGALKDLVVKGFEALADGYTVMGKKHKDIMMGAAMMGLVGLSMLPFAFALGLMANVTWTAVIAGLGFMLASVLMLYVLGTMSTGPQIGLLLVGMGILLAVGAMMLMVAISLGIAADNFQKLSAIDWSFAPNMAMGLSTLIPSMIAFSIAGMLFANPITMLGMMLMVGALASIALVLTPLALALDMGSKGLDGMAEGVLTLGDSLAKLDFEKLDKLKDFSQAMATASLGAAVFSAMVSVIEAIGKIGGGDKGGGGAGTESKPIVIQLTLPSGRVLEEHIIKDLDKVS